MYDDQSTIIPFRKKVKDKRREDRRQGNRRDVGAAVPQDVTDKDDAFAYISTSEKDKKELVEEVVALQKQQNINISWQEHMLYYIWSFVFLAVSILWLLAAVM